MSMQSTIIRPDSSNFSGLNTGTVTIDSTMVRCTGRYSATTVGGIQTARHDGGAVISGMGTGTLTFTLVTSTPSVNPSGYRASSLYVDGKYATDFVTTVDNTSQSFTYALGTGFHYWELWEATNYNPSSPTFTSLYQVSGTVSVQSSLPSPANRVAVWGDSIAIGVTESIPMQQGTVARLRQMYPQGWIAADAIPGRKSGDDSAATFGTEVAALVSGGTTRKCVTLIGYNDYGNNVSAATFQTNLAAQLDNAHAADSGITFIVLGPIIASVETANGAGNTLDDYRTACSTVCGTRGWTTYVNAKTWISTSDLSDGIHPNAAGAAKIAGNIAYLL